MESKLIESFIQKELNTRTDAMYEAYRGKEEAQEVLRMADKRHRGCAKHVAALIEEVGRTSIDDGWTKFTITPEGLLLEDVSGRGRDSSLVPFEESKQ